MDVIDAYALFENKPDALSEYAMVVDKEYALHTRAHFPRRALDTRHRVIPVYPLPWLTFHNQITYIRSEE
jgi:hypothetical protein